MFSNLHPILQLLVVLFLGVASVLAIDAALAAARRAQVYRRQWSR